MLVCCIMFRLGTILNRVMVSSILNYAIQLQLSNQGSLRTTKQFEVHISLETWDPIQSTEWQFPIINVHERHRERATKNNITTNDVVDDSNVETQNLASLPLLFPTSLLLPPSFPIESTYSVSNPNLSRPPPPDSRKTSKQLNNSPIKRLSLRRLITS